MKLVDNKDGWKRVRLDDVVIRREENDRENARTRFDTFVKVEHMEAGSLHLRQLGLQKDAELPPTFYKIFREGQILFPTRNPHLRRTALAPCDGICGEKTLTLEVNAEIADPRFIPFLFHSASFYDHSAGAIIGSTNPHCRWRDIANYEFLLPPKDQQTKLAELLWAADGAVEALLAAQSRLQSLIEAERREMDRGDVSTHTGEELTTIISKGASPKWQGFNYTDSGMLFVTSENVLDDEIDLKEGKYLPLEFNNKQKRSQLRKGDVLINLVGASIGRLAVFDVDVEIANVNQAVGVFRCDTSKALPEYIVQYLLERGNNQRLVNNQSESARPNLSLTNLREFKFHIPSVEEQKRRIAKIVSVKDTFKQTKSHLGEANNFSRSLINQIF